jgi:hypothetical protein
MVLDNDLARDAGRPTDFGSEYRLRVDDFRVLFGTENSKVIVYRIKT